MVFFCPKHGHSAGRTVGQLSVNLECDWFNCWSCGFASKSLYPLIRLADPNAAREYMGEEGGRLRKRAERQYDKPQLPSGFKPLSRSSRSFFRPAFLKYLYERGLTDDDILLYRLGYVEDGQFKNRVIFPSFDAYGDLNFVTSRYIYDDIPSQARYKNGGNYDKDVIFNEYLVDWKETIVLVEGPFDAMAAGTNAVPLQGVRLNEESQLFQKIVVENCDVVIALDADASKKQLKLVENFLDYGISPRVVKFSGDEDPAELGKDGFASRLAISRKIQSSWDIAKIRIGA